MLFLTIKSIYYTFLLLTLRTIRHSCSSAQRSWVYDDKKLGWNDWGRGILQGM
jgi:hypothetical protein